MKKLKSETLRISEREYSQNNIQIEELITQYLNLQIDKMLTKEYDKREVRAISNKEVE